MGFFCGFWTWRNLNGKKITGHPSGGLDDDDYDGGDECGVMMRVDAIQC